MRGNSCDGNERTGLAINSSRYAVVVDNLVTGNGNHGVAFWANSDVQDVGHHLLSSNVYDNNKVGEIHIALHHPAIWRLQDRWPSLL